MPIPHATYIRTPRSTATAADLHVSPDTTEPTAPELLTPAGGRRQYDCYTCEVVTPPMTAAEAAAERAAGHDLREFGQ